MYSLGRLLLPGRPPLAVRRLPLLASSAPPRRFLSRGLSEDSEGKWYVYQDVEGMSRISKKYEDKDSLLADLRAGGLNETTLEMLEKLEYVPSMIFEGGLAIAHGVAVSTALEKMDSLDYGTEDEDEEDFIEDEDVGQNDEDKSK